jgi:protein-disulfide isomerase
MIQEPWRIGLGVAVLVLALPLGLSAQEQKELEEQKKGQESAQTQAEIMKEIEALKKGQEEIRKQLEEIMKMLRSRPAPSRAAAVPNVDGVVFDLGKNPVRGESTAQLTLVEFTDYQ